MCTVAAFSQVPTPLKVYQSAGSISGEIWLQEPRSGGQNWWQLSVPVLAGDKAFVAPAALPASNGECLKSTTAGVLSFAACGGVPFLVTDYGAVCDGVANDTAAIQAAINAAQTAGGGSVVLPRGTCNVTTVNVSAHFIGLRGQGRSMSILQGTTNAATIAVSTAAGNVSSFELNTLTIQNSAGGADSVGVHVTGANKFEYSVFRNVYFGNYRRAIHLANAGVSFPFHFSGNVCYTSSVVSGTCIDAASSIGSGSIISNNYFANGAGGRAIYLHDSNIGDLVINDNHNEGGLYFLDADCASSPVAPCTYGQRLVVNDNKVDNTTGAAPIRFNKISNSSAFGNVIMGVDTVLLVGASLYNRIDVNSGQGIQMSSSSGELSLNGYSSGRIRIGAIDENISNTTNGVSIKDASANVGIGIGQTTGSSLGMLWTYDATPANAYASIYTFDFLNPIYFQASALYFQTDGAARWKVTSAGMLEPEVHDALDIGLDTSRVRALYSRIVDTAVVGGTTDYVQTRKLQLYDNTGASGVGVGFWDMNCVVSGTGAFSENYCYMRDSSGVKAWQSEAVRSGSAVNRTYFYHQLIDDRAGPGLGVGINTSNFHASGGSGFVGYSMRRTDDTAGGWLIGTSAAALGDFAIYRNTGTGSAPLRKLSITGAGDFTLDGFVTGNFGASFDGEVTASTSFNSTTGYRVSGTTVIDSSRNLINIGTGNFSGLLTAGSLSVSGTSTLTGAITATAGIATGSSSNSTMYVGSGNLYIRSFSGADASCTGITNGWIGLRTDTNEIQMCNGGVMKKVALT